MSLRSLAFACVVWKRNIALAQGNLLRLAVSSQLKLSFQIPCAWAREQNGGGRGWFWWKAMHMSQFVFTYVCACVCLHACVASENFPLERFSIAFTWTKRHVVKRQVATCHKLAPLRSCWMSEANRQEGNWNKRRFFYFWWNANFGLTFVVCRKRDASLQNRCFVGCIVLLKTTSPPF